VPAGTREAASPFGLDAGARAELERRAERAIARSRRERRPVLASVTVPVPPDLDVSAAVLRARRPDDRYFCLEQPDRDGYALAALGEAASVEERRFGAAAAAARALGRDAEAGDGASDPAAPAATGPVWIGGFAFAEQGGSSPEWSGLGAGQIVMPEVSLARGRGQARLTATVWAAPDDEAGSLIERVERRLSELEPAEMPMRDPDPVERARVASAAPPEHFVAAVARAVERIEKGEITKVVLAREVRVHASRRIDPAPVYDGLRASFPSCYSYLVGTPELAFLGASPELLVRRDGARAQTVALAGTVRRSDDPAVDDHLAEQLRSSPHYREEQAIVTRRIERTLRPVSVWVAAAEEPVVVKVQNVQHLGTPIRAQLAEPVSCIELAGLLHPTPAVGGEPRDRALALIPALEGLDRGWYAGAVGWTDLAEDGELCVALRCALIRDRVAHLYAGEGIVRGSDPAEELAVNEAKLQALLPLLT
jgi:salicylate biosynthesis isochorismate synthase/menaquinone-specific isochorismate synthase